MDKHILYIPQCRITFQEVFFSSGDFFWLNRGFFYSRTTDRLDLILAMCHGNYGRSNSASSFLHIEEGRKNSSAVNGYSQFHPAFGSVQNSCTYLLFYTHICLFLLLCCSYTPVLSSGSLFYLWLDFNSPFFPLPLLWSGPRLWFAIKAHIHFSVSIKTARYNLQQPSPLLLLG